MEKKATRLDKGSKKHPLYGGQKIFFGTQHEKERILAPVFRDLEIDVQGAPINTDQFGTFSGEVPRGGGVRETLRRKIQETLKSYPQAELLLASEGSFGPHPYLPFAQSNHEALLFFDKSLQHEVYVEEITPDTNHCEIEFTSDEELEAWLKQVSFPSHGVIVRSPSQPDEIRKGLTSRADLEAALRDFQRSSPRLILMTDMRAHFNPKRQKAIEKVGLKLREALLSQCPRCQTPGFVITRGQPGLVCSDCGSETNLIKQVELECRCCGYLESRPRPDGLQAADPAECPFCNP
ncbi:MAG: DUF6671 family protein [Bdellovibrionales bacterium]